MKSAPPLHIQTSDNDFPLISSNTAGRIVSILANPENSQVVALITERGFAIWSASESATIEKDLISEFPQADPLTMACWGDKGNTLFIASGPHILEYDPEVNQFELRFKCPVGMTWMGWWPQHKVLILLTEEGSLSFFDFKQEQNPFHQIQTQGIPTHADLNSAENVLAVVEQEKGNRQFITIMELTSLEIYTRFQCPLQGQVSCISIAANGRRVAIGSQEGEVICRSFSVREEPKSPDYYSGQSQIVGSLNQPKAHQGPVTDLAWSKKKEYLLASTGADGNALLYNTSSRKCLGTQEITTWKIMGADFMNDFLVLSIGTSKSSNNPDEGPFTLAKAIPSKFPK